MNVRITPRRLSGSVTPPGSKSMAHRLLIAAALASGESVIEGVAPSENAEGVAPSEDIPPERLTRPCRPPLGGDVAVRRQRGEDIEATLRCLAALGASWDVRNNAYRVTGIGANPALFKMYKQVVARLAASSRTPDNLSEQALPRFDCGESGSTLRFMIPIALAVTGGGVFTGHGRLMERPLTPYWTLFDEKGISYERNGNALTVRGTLTPGLYRLPGDVSSQFFTGLLFALPLLDGESVLESATPLQSAPYVRMTMDALSLAGVRIDVDGDRVGVDENRVGADGDANRFVVRPQPCRAFRAAVETDWSQAAFWYAANFLGADVDIQGLNPDSAQGDKIIASLSESMRRDGELVIDMSDCPDLLPPLAVMSAVRHGLTRFVNAGRLRMKESDRLSSVARMLRALGIDTEEGADFLNVTGGTLRGGVADGANDHRIVMAAAVAASVCAEGVTITGADAVRKSYPDFWEQYQSLGGEIRIL